MSNFQHPDPMIEFLVKQAEWAEYDLQELRREEIKDEEEFYHKQYQPTDEDEEEFYQWLKQYQPTEEDEEELYQWFKQNVLDEVF